jgi:hypothetical protein
MCAAEAIFCYTAENSHYLEAQVTSKNLHHRGGQGALVPWCRFTNLPAPKVEEFKAKNYLSGKCSLKNGIVFRFKYNLDRISYRNFFSPLGVPILIYSWKTTLLICTYAYSFCILLFRYYEIQIKKTSKICSSKRRKYQKEERRSQVTLEKSSKTIFLCLVESPQEGYPHHTPPLRMEISHILHVVSRQVRSADAISTRRIYSWGGGGGEGDLRNGAIR